jgi:hypothetical protein
MNMKRLIVISVSAVALLVLVPAIHSQDQLVPAGTLLQCTLDEPNFSSATAAVGDPVLCHLRTMQQFGRPLFPRGSMLGGHLEADKEPGHFFGKGYLKLSFDRIILPNGDLPVPAKVIQARGFKVDKQGAIDGKGHPKRDVVEWMIPPLWPWKVVSLPFRGPRPTLKGEEPMQLRLMDDIVIPRTLAQISHPDRPPYASSTQPSGYRVGPQSSAMQLAVEKRVIYTNETPANAQPAAALETAGDLQISERQPTEPQSRRRFTILVLKSSQIYEVTEYRRDGDLLMFRDLQGRKGGVDVKDVDWRKTSEMTAQVRSVDAPLVSRQTN